MPENEPALKDYEGRNLDPITRWFVGLVDHDQFKDPYLPGRFQRQTHIDEGLHVRLFLNKHIKEQSKPEECFIEAGIQQNKKDPNPESYHWAIDEDPAAIYPGEEERIKELLGAFEPVEEVVSD
jgi:hypothetical protein